MSGRPPFPILGRGAQPINHVPATQEEAQMTAKKRTLGIELLRISAMLTIILIHLLWKGGPMYALTPAMPQYPVGWFLACAVIPCVDVFALITGYVAYGTRHRLSSLARLCVQMLVLNLGITLVALLLGARPGRLELARSVVPVLFGRHWYAAAYLCLFPFLPLLDRLVDSLTQEKARVLVLTLALVFSVIPTLSVSDFAFTGRGYSAVWLAVMYLLGACAKKHGWLSSLRPRQGLLIYLGSTLLLLFSKLLVDDRLVPLVTGGFDKNASIFVTYDSPLAVLGALALVCSFAHMEERPRLRPAIEFWSELAFGVYIIHSAPLVYDRLIGGNFAWLANLHPALLIPACIAVSAGVFVGTGLVERLRILLFARIGAGGWFSRLDDGRYRIV